MTKFAIILLLGPAGSGFAGEPGKGYKRVEQITPGPQREFFGGPHIDAVIEVYRRPDETKCFRMPFKSVLSSWAEPVA